MRSFFMAACLLLGPTWIGATETIYRSTVPEGVNTATYPAPRDSWYMEVQKKFDRFSGKPADIVFEGDSITNRWEGTGRECWKRFADRAADFGIEGDRTENALWRLSKGQVDGIDPKLVVIMIGTNNVYFNSAEQIADGIKALVADYQKRCPHAHIALMGIFPRGAKASDSHRIKVAAVNARIAALDDGKRVTFIDISSKMIEADGSISPDLMRDFVHPEAKGYQIWADAIQPLADRYAPARK